VVIVAAAVVAGAVTVGAAASRPTATVDVQAVRVAPPQPALLVSDSAWLGIKTYGAIDAMQGFHHVLDLASCRRRVTGSCRNYDGHVPITLLQELDAHGDSFHTLVVATGYNDGSHNFESDFERIVARARQLSYERIVWVTLRANVSYTSPDDYGFDAVFRANNSSLRSLVASGRYPDVVIADWATYAHDQVGWFAGDGIHLRGDGPWAAADYVSRKLAFLDGRRCPMPARAGQALQSPCPDPDASPPQVELASIYPIGEPNPTVGFHMEWEGSGAWPSLPWWKR
jgi:hypothetical protein